MQGESPKKFKRSSSKKLRTKTDNYQRRSSPMKLNSPKALKFKANTESLFGDFATEIQTRSLETIMSEYCSNPFYKTKISIILAEFERNLEENQISYEEFLEQMLFDTKSEASSFNKGDPIKYQTLKNKVGKNNYAYALRLMEIKEKIKQLKK